MTFFVQINSNEIDKPLRILDVPPQYDLENVPLQRVFVPMIYGIMHTALYCLGWIPVAMMRGFQRDLVSLFPASRQVSA